MNITVIILGIVIIILIYVLYKYVTKPSALTKDLIDLNKTTQSIPLDKIVGKNSAKYSYGAWIYVNSWNSNRVKVLIKRGDVATPDMMISLDTNVPTLKYTYKEESTNNPKKEIVITTDFPLQKWVFVIVNVDGTIVDAYIDGKLVLSKKLEKPPTTQSNAQIDLGEANNTNDIYLAKVSRWDTVIDPQTAWNYYMEGNGISSGVLPNYNVKLGLYKDNTQTKEFSLF